MPLANFRATPTQSWSAFLGWRSPKDAVYLLSMNGYLLVKEGKAYPEYLQETKDRLIPGGGSRLTHAAQPTLVPTGRDHGFMWLVARGSWLGAWCDPLAIRPLLHHCVRGWRVVMNRKEF